MQCAVKIRKEDLKVYYEDSDKKQDSEIWKRALLAMPLFSHDDKAVTLACCMAFPKHNSWANCDLYTRLQLSFKFHQMMGKWNQ